MEGGEHNTKLRYKQQESLLQAYKRQESHIQHYTPLFFCVLTRCLQTSTISRQSDKEEESHLDKENYPRFQFLTQAKFEKLEENVAHLIHLLCSPKFFCSTRYCPRVATSARSHRTMLRLNFIPQTLAQSQCDNFRCLHHIWKYTRGFSQTWRRSSAGTKSSCGLRQWEISKERQWVR